MGTMIWMNHQCCCNVCDLHHISRASQRRSSGSMERQQLVSVGSDSEIFLYGGMTGGTQAEVSERQRCAFLYKHSR